MTLMYTPGASFKRRRGGFARARERAREIAALVAA